MITNAASDDKPIAIYKANAFWIAYFQIMTIDGSGESTITTHHHDPIYGDSQAIVLGLPLGLTLDDYEEAGRQ